jgi:hypothetical protein
LVAALVKALKATANPSIAVLGEDQLDGSGAGVVAGVRIAALKQRLERATA